MIIVSVISLIISFFLHGLVSNLQSFTLESFNWFSCPFLLINFVVLHSYFESDKRFLTLIIVFGVLFDIVYSNTLVLCTAFFILVFYLNKLYSFFFPSNVFTVNFFSLIAMIIYHILSFAFLRLLQFDSYNLLVLFRVILSNLFMNIVYTTILYYAIKLVYEKFNLKIVRI